MLVHSREQIYCKPDDIVTVCEKRVNKLPRSIQTCLIRFTEDARLRPRRAAACNALASFPEAVRLFINPKCCLPQEFSDEEEDIDALISAHNKTDDRHLSSALSTVLPMSQRDSGKSCMLSAQICTRTRHHPIRDMPIVLVV